MESPGIAAGQSSSSPSMVTPISAGAWTTEARGFLRLDLPVDVSPTLGAPAFAPASLAGSAAVAASITGPGRAVGLQQSEPLAARAFSAPLPVTRHDGDGLGPFAHASTSSIGRAAASTIRIGRPILEIFCMVGSMPSAWPPWPRSPAP